MEGTCNLECWCHVPRRGLSKPPCYLCVVQDCSHSCKPMESSSAPIPHPKEHLEASAPSYQDVVASARVGVASEGKITYGWRPELTIQHAKFSSSSTYTEDQEHQSLATESSDDLRLDMNHDEGAVGGTTADNPAVEFPSYYHPSGDLLTTEVGFLDQVGSGSPETLERRQSPSEPQPGGSCDTQPDKFCISRVSGVNGKYEKENRQGKLDLSDRIKSLVLGTDDSLFQEWEAENFNVQTGTLPLYEDVPTPRGSRPNRHENSRLGSRSYSAPDKNFGSSQSAVNSESSTRKDEEDYHRINKINRRESSKEAARRHLQREENPFTRRRWKQSGQRVLALARGGPMGLPGPQDGIRTHKTPSLVVSEWCDR